MSLPEILIGSKFDAKGFKQAETALTKLSKNVHSLTRSLGLGLGTAAIVGYAKASVKAFAADEKAATSLGQTLKNLNLAYGSNIGTVNGYISRLEAQTGVLDDELRPAMDRLLRATSSVTKSQELLNLSLDIAAGTGKSVTQVSQSLQKAYLGQNQALGRLGVGLTKTELTSSSFEEIQTRLTTLFAGQATAAAQSYAGELARLSVAANNAKETIGKGLIDAIGAASGSKGFGGAIDGIGKVSTSIASAAKNIGFLIGYLDKLKPVLVGIGVLLALYFFPITTAIIAAVAALSKLGSYLKKRSFSQGVIPGGMGNVAMTGGTNQDLQKSDAVAKDKAAKAALEASKKLAAIQAALLKTQKDQLKLDKAKAMFDLKKIGIAAALTGNISPDAKNRLLAMQAIENGNADLAAKYSSKINPNASMNVTVHVAGSVTSATDLVNTVRKGLLDANVAGQQTNIRRTGTTAMRAI